MADGDDDWVFGSSDGSGSDEGSALSGESGEDVVAAPQGFGSRLGDSIGAIIVGLIVVPLACFGLFWNEGHAVRVAKALDEAGRLVHSVPSDRLDTAYMGKLVHVAGETTSAKGVSDEAMGVTAKGLKLDRSVQMYQWKEKESGSGQDRRFSYSREWSSSAVSSSGFHAQSGHQNPSFPSYKSKDIGAADAKVEAVPVGAKAALRLGGAEDLTVEESGIEVAKKTTGRPVQLSGGGYYVGQNPEAPKVGDVRITYRVVREGPASFIGRQEASGLEAYRATNGEEILLGYSGIHPAADVIQMGQDDNRLWTWVVRAIGLVAMLIGFFMLFSPVNVLASYVPILGSVVSGATFLVALVATLVVGPTVIAIAWFAYRPLLAGGILLGAVALVLAFRQFRRRRRSPAGLAPA